MGFIGNKKNKNEIKHPLSHIDQDGLEKKSNKKDSQISMNFEKNPLQIWYKFKNSLFVDIEKRFQASYYWKSFINIFTVVTVIFTLITPIAATYIFWNKLPQEIPFFYLHELKVREVYPKQTFYFFPILLGSLEAIVVYLSYRIYEFDQRLSKIINIFIVLVSLAYFVYIWQIIVLLLV